MNGTERQNIMYLERRIEKIEEALCVLGAYFSDTAPEHYDGYWSLKAIIDGFKNEEEESG